MSYKKVVFNIDNIPQAQLVYKRLLSVALYDYVNLHTPISIDNVANVRKFLEILIPNYNVEHIVNWFLQEYDNGTNNKPNKFELMLLFNQMKCKSNYVIKRLKVASTNISQWKKDTTIKPYVLDNNTLMVVRNEMLKINWTKFDYNIFTKIEFNFNQGGSDE